MIRRVLLLNFVLSLCVSAYAQQDPQFTQYMFNNLYYNPGFSGLDGVARASALFRSQWSGYQPTFPGGGAPTTQLVSYSAPLTKLKSGVGGYILNDKLGPQSNLEAQASFAYHIAVRDSKISIGLRAGLYSQTIDSDLYRAIDKEDPHLPPANSGRYSQTKPDLGLGIVFNKEKYYVGLGFSHVNQSKFDFFSLNQNNRLEMHTYVTAGYFYELNFDTKIQFVTLIKSDFVKTQYDLGAIAHLRNTMWAGLSFRQSEAAIVLLGWSFLKDKSLKAGYAMDVIVKDRAAKQQFSHELMVSYNLPVSPGVGRKVVRTPRYRH